MNASGEFTVKMEPMDTFAQGVDGNKLGRMSIDKTFNGDLEASSKGEMLSCMTSVQGSAGYVAIEQVQGTLAGKSGSFVLQHYGIMDANGQHLTLEVIPDSAQGELQGLTGSMQIIIKDGNHFYEFDYQL